MWGELWSNFEKYIRKKENYYNIKLVSGIDSYLFSLRFYNFFAVANEEIRILHCFYNSLYGNFDKNKYFCKIYKYIFFFLFI